MTDDRSASILPLLITGLAGVPGYNAFRHFRALYPGQVIGTRRVDNWPLTGAGVVGCDADSPEQLARLFDQFPFRAVLACEGLCKLKSCELDRALAQRVNVQSVQTLLDVIRDRAVRLVHLSVDLVFSGNGSGRHTEVDPTDPVTVYGETMVQAEQLVLNHRPDACVLRISLPMGVSFNGHAGAIDWIQSRFKKSKPATLYFDEIRSPTYTDCLNAVLGDVLRRQDLRGLYHAGGPRHLSLYQIAQVVNRVGGYAPALLFGRYRREADPIPPRAGDVTLNSDKLTAALGYAPFAPWPWFEQHVPTDPDWHLRRQAGELGSPELLAQVLYRRPSECLPA